MATNINVSIRYSTFLPVLLEVMQRTTGDVLELGAGVFSTPLLHWLCERRYRHLLTIESDEKWFNFCRQYYKYRGHQFQFVNNWDDANIEKPWDVALIDHSPSGRRVEEIKRLANLAKYIIIHDSNPWNDRHYHYSTIYPLFKYRFDFKEAEPFTTLLSNFEDISNFTTRDKDINELGKDIITPLCEIAYKYGTDKCPQLHHCYTPFYYDFLKDKRDSFKKIVEVGVGSVRKMAHMPSYTAGGGLRMWRDFFPNAHVYGIDIDPGAMFEDDRITTYLLDETKKEDLINLIENTGNDIDLFIDDGDHHHVTQMFLFKTIMPLLNKDAIYIVEDSSHSRQFRKEIANDYNVFIPELPKNKFPWTRDKLIVITNK